VKPLLNFDRYERGGRGDFCDDYRQLPRDAERFADDQSSGACVGNAESGDCDGRKFFDGTVTLGSAAPSAELS